MSRRIATVGGLLSLAVGLVALPLAIVINLVCRGGDEPAPSTATLCESGTAFPLALLLALTSVSSVVVGTVAGHRGDRWKPLVAGLAGAGIALALMLLLLNHV